jgi:uncharacterized protein YdhG (YjbR/CyaY superfamily)
MNQVNEVDRYLATVPETARKALRNIRKAIKAAAPEASEGISYGVPAYKHHGMLVGFGASKAHCSFFVMSSTFLDGFQRELAGYETSKGAIRFTPERPLPASLVRKLVKARIKENEARAKSRTRL